MLITVLFCVSLIATEVTLNVGQGYDSANSNVATNTQVTGTDSQASDAAVNSASPSSRSSTSRVKSAGYLSPFNNYGLNYGNSNSGYNYWNSYRKQRTYLVCPNETTVYDNYQLSGDPTGYPAQGITIAIDANPDLNNCLQYLAVPPNLPTKPEPMITPGATKTCMEVNRRLWSYHSVQHNANCWIISGYQPPVIYAECPNSPISGCSMCNTNTRRSPYGYTSNNKVKKCLKVYNYIIVFAYCNLPGTPKIIRDRIVIPTHCACAEVACSEHLIHPDPPSWPYYWPY